MENTINHYWLYGLTVFMGFFAMLNPIGNLPLFLGMVQDFDDKTQKKVAFNAVITAFIIITIFSIFGHIIFRLFGITLPAFQIAGGIIVFLIGYQMLNAKESSLQAQTQQEREAMTRVAKDMAITPLGIPLLAGPGTISTAMNFVGTSKSISNAVFVLFIFAIICLITYTLFITGRTVFKRVNPGILKVVSRIMGLILAVIAVQMLIHGIASALAVYK